LELLDAAEGWKVVLASKILACKNGNAAANFYRVIVPPLL
jgi:hypothetical protein